MGFVTPVVHALTYEDYKIESILTDASFLSANAEILYLASNVAKPKVKGIDGESLQLWII